MSTYAGRIGFVGIGSMGFPMVRRLRAAGFDLVLADKSPDLVAEAATELDAAIADAPAHLESVGLVICMLPDSNVVEAVLEGDAGLLAALRPGTIVMDMGSSDPRRTQRLARLAAERAIDLVDAPVSGGVARAVAGDLAIMFGGTSSLFGRLHTVLSAMGSTIVHVGDVGAGHAMKALNNLLSATGLAAACEVLEAGKEFGLKPETMLEVLNRSSGRNNATEAKIAQFVISESYASGFGLRLMLKDIRIALELTRSLGIEASLSETCLHLWEQAADVLPIDADHTMVAKVIMQGRSERK